MRTSVWIAFALFAIVAAWLASGLFIAGGEEEEATQAEEPQPTLVAVGTSTAEPVPQYIYAQGVAQPFRTADVNLSTGGTLAEVQAQQGQVVSAGDVLARVRLDARESQLQSARSQVESLEADLEAARDLAEEGFATESRVRELESQLENARAELESIRADIRDTTIEAPISGIVSDVFVNSGETASAGTSIARIVDNAPLRVALNISQRDVGRVDVDREAVVSFATGALAKGRVCFVAPAADPETRTFRVEIRVPNEDRSIPSVVSTEVRFQTGEAAAHFISPAILALNEAGVLGVKSVNEQNIVQFHPMEIVRAEGDGIWVAGLPETIRLITVGQGFVREGERVRIQEEAASNQEAVTGDTIGRAPLPTATVEAETFDGAADLPAPPPAEELCQGSAANAVLTSSVPGGSGAGAAGSQGSQQPQPGGTAAGNGVRAPATDEPAAEGSSGAAQSLPNVPSVNPSSPEIPTPTPAPSTGQSPSQTPGSTGSQQPGGGAGTPPAGAGNGASGAGAPSSGGGAGDSGP